MGAFDCWFAWVNAVAFLHGNQHMRRSEDVRDSQKAITMSRKKRWHSDCGLRSEQEKKRPPFPIARYFFSRFLGSFYFFLERFSRHPFRWSPLLLWMH